MTRIKGVGRIHSKRLLFAADCVVLFSISLLASCSPPGSSQISEAASQPASASENGGFTSLFNGEKFDGWQGALDQYEIRDGSIVSKAGGNIFTKREYSDFVWRMEFKLPPGGNNGLAIRYSGKGDPAYKGMCELQVLDDTADQYADLDPRQFHGSIYGIVPAERGHLKPVGEWNDQEVQVIGSRIKVVLNGTVILDADQAGVTEFMSDKMKNEIPASGFLGFAGHGPGVAFRNLKIKRL